MIEADDTERGALLARSPALVGVALARTLKDMSLAAWYDDPVRAGAAAVVLGVLTTLADDLEVDAHAAWADGIASLAAGQMERAIANLDLAAERFEQLGQPLESARVQVARLTSLAILGRYDEAISSGLAARDVLLAHGDEVAAGRIEGNLGHIAFRRDYYADAERYYRLAHSRLRVLDDPAQLAHIEIALADVLTQERQFNQARELYEHALSRAETAGLEVVQAVAERNLGNLSLSQAHYDEALAYLERSRRRYASLEIPHELAYADLELAEVYLELNLAPEAATIFQRAITLFAELGMRSEHAWALAHYGQTMLLLGDKGMARARFVEGRQLFEAEGSAVSAAIIALFEAQLLYREEQYSAAAALAASTAATFHAAGNQGRQLHAAWLHGEALRAAGNLTDAQQILEDALQAAEAASAPQIAQRCATSLGLLAAARGDLPTAELRLARAVSIIEELRAPLPAEEFRTAFLSDKLSPFAELTRICLATGRTAEALGYVERARSRALVEMLGSTTQSLARPRDAFETEQIARLAELRQELTWYYQRISRALESDGYAASSLAHLQSAAQEREAAILELNRQLQQHGGGDLFTGAALNLARLQAALGTETALIEYAGLDGQLLAFVVTAEEVAVVRDLAPEQTVEEMVEWLRFQTDAMAHEVGRATQNLPALLQRTRHYLARLYDLLLRPLAGLLSERRLVIVPHRALHYVPFRALFDGEQYVIEQREICTAPSAAVLQHCLLRQTPGHPRAVFVGVPDERAPHVRDEVLAIAPHFPDRVTLLGEEATIANLQRHAPEAGVLHLACHGQFRADNPLFSSLRLADGWLTVRDAYDLDLSCDLVVLSACETGVSAVAPGDELIGLARGFFAAGAPSVVVSLWRVDDATTAELMGMFYARLRAGDRPAAALRHAQRALMQRHLHPFYWAPFVLMGRW